MTTGSPFCLMLIRLYDFKGYDSNSTTQKRTQEAQVELFAKYMPLRKAFNFPDLTENYLLTNDWAII